MNEDKVIKILNKHAERQFPKTCTNCGVVFNSLAEYIEDTIRVGDPVSYDAEMGNWEPKQPIGTVFFVNCKCKSTLSISSNGMNTLTLIRLMHWFKSEARKRGVSPEELLRDIRFKIRISALNN